MHADHHRRPQPPDLLLELKLNRVLDRETLEMLVKRKLGHYCSELTERMYRNFVSNKIDEKELKAKYSWSLLEFMVGLTRDLRANDQQIKPILTSSRI